MYDPEKGDHHDQIAGAFVILILVAMAVLIISTVASHAKGAEPVPRYTTAQESLLEKRLEYRVQRAREKYEPVTCSPSRERVMRIVGVLTEQYRQNPNHRTKAQLDKLREQITSGVDPRKIIAAYERRQAGSGPGLRGSSAAVFQRTP